MDIDCAQHDQKWQLLARDICHEEHERALVTTRVDGVLKSAVRYLPIVQKKQEAHTRTYARLRVPHNIYDTH